MLGAIEAGGTKFVCAVSDDEFNIIKRHSIPTTTPNETMAAVLAFFKSYTIEALGIGSFGPIDSDSQSETYGYITTTPKKKWQQFDLVGAVQKELNVPIVWTTDVNAAAYGEVKSGAAKGKRNGVYLTVGTGIGGGAVLNGKVLEGFSHPEMGHISVKRHPEDTYVGSCPFHGDCLEGLAAGPSLELRTGIKGEKLKSDEKVWEMEAFYLGQALKDYTLILAPDIIILGGGVSKQAHLLPKIKQQFAEQLGGYVNVPSLDEYIVRCQLGDNAGIVGCLHLAADKLNAKY